MGGHGHSGLGHHLVGTQKHDAHIDNHRYVHLLSYFNFIMGKKLGMNLELDFVRNN